MKNEKISVEGPKNLLKKFKIMAIEREQKLNELFQIAVKEFKKSPKKPLKEVGKGGEKMVVTIGLTTDERYEIKRLAVELRVNIKTLLIAIVQAYVKKRGR